MGNRDLARGGVDAVALALAVLRRGEHGERLRGGGPYEHPYYRNTVKRFKLSIFPSDIEE